MFGIGENCLAGDHPITAASIARQIGLLGVPDKVTPGPAGNRFSITMHKDNEEVDERVVHGEKLKNLSDADWDRLLKNNRTLVFARTTPEQKLLIVEQCQKRNEIVAVTGQSVHFLFFQFSVHPILNNFSNKISLSTGDLGGSVS